MWVRIEQGLIAGKVCPYESPGKVTLSKMKSVVAMHRETWYAVSKIRNDRRYAECIDRVSDEELAGGVSMDALDYLIAEGETKGEEKVNKLGLMLTEAGRIDDFMKSLSDINFQKRLFIEFGLEQEK